MAVQDLPRTPSSLVSGDPFVGGVEGRVSSLSVAMSEELPSHLHENTQDVDEEPEGDKLQISEGEDYVAFTLEGENTEDLDKDLQENTTVSASEKASAAEVVEDEDLTSQGTAVGHPSKGAFETKDLREKLTGPGSLQLSEAGSKGDLIKRGTKKNTGGSAVSSRSSRGGEGMKTCSVKLVSLESASCRKVVVDSKPVVVWSPRKRCVLPMGLR